MKMLSDLLANLAEVGVVVRVKDDGNLGLSPSGRTPPHLLAEVRRVKSDLLRYLKGEDRATELSPPRPFNTEVMFLPMTDEQNVEVCRLVVEEQWRYLVAKRHVLEG